MGTNTLSNSGISTSSTVQASHVTQFYTALNEVLVPRNSSGVPTSDGAALGSTTYMFSDLFLASGSVINFNNGDVTITHAANVLGIEGGSVAIGRATPSTTLHVEGVLPLRVTRDVSGTSYGLTTEIDATKFYIDGTGGTPATDILVIKHQTGQVGLSTSDPSATLDVVGTVEFSSVYNNDINGSTYRDLLIRDDGILGYDSSTERKKANIIDMENIDWIYNLRPVNFNYLKKDEENKYTNTALEKKEWGLIAEEVQKIKDEFVFYNNIYQTDIEGEYILDENNNKIVESQEIEGVYYKKFIPVLIKAIKDLKAEIDILKGQ